MQTINELLCASAFLSWWAIRVIPLSLRSLNDIRRVSKEDKFLTQQNLQIACLFTMLGNTISIFTKKISVQKK